jgi:hypothetical protein
MTSQKVAMAHVGALKVVDEDLSEILSASNDISWKMTQPGPGIIDQVDWDELDDEEILVRSALSTREAVLLQPNTRVSFVVVLDDVA